VLVAIAALVLVSLVGLGLGPFRQAAPPVVPAAKAPEDRAAEGAVPRAEYPEDFHPALKGNAGEVPGLTIYGPDAAECVKFKPEGLRIILPPTFPRQRPGTGVVTDFGVRGDFEITVGYEIVQEPFPRPAGSNSTELRLVVVPNEYPRPGMWHRADQNRATLSRQTATLTMAPVPVPGGVVRLPPGQPSLAPIPVRRRADLRRAATLAANLWSLAAQAQFRQGIGAGALPYQLGTAEPAITAPPQEVPLLEVPPQAAPPWPGTGHFQVDLTRWNNEDIPKDPWGNELFGNVEAHATRRSPATERAGRLRLVRSGPTLSFFTSEGEGKDFTLLSTAEFGTTDLKNVRILGSTSWEGNLFDVRVTDVRVRAEAFVRAGEEARPATASAVRWWLIGGVAFLVLMLAVTVSLGAWYYTRRRRRAAATPAAPAAAAEAIAFECSGCGKRLRARREQAGRKLKCPQCQQGIFVPQARPHKPEELL
jgi:hypothetical protein